MFTRRFTRARAGLIGLLLCSGFLLQSHLDLLSTPPTQTGSQTGVAYAQEEPPTDEPATKIYLPSIAKEGVPSAVGTATATPEKALAQQLQALTNQLTDSRVNMSIVEM